MLPVEVGETVKHYLDGKIDQWFSLQDAQRRTDALDEIASESPGSSRPARR